PFFSGETPRWGFPSLIAEQSNSPFLRFGRRGHFALCGARWGAQYGKPMSLQANSSPQPLRFFEKIE
ncbi:MAG: hypothetical protein MJ062_02355, partial [Oscillospiraceae bacterium]|nr:hypothetical protein [Oscillospiraceae bacterium]